MLTPPFKSHFVNRLDEVCRQHPDRFALVDCDVAGSLGGSLTYRALDAGAQQLAQVLSAAGVQEYEPIIVFVSNVKEDLLSLLGVWRAGCVAVPMHRDSGAESIRKVLQQTRARICVTGHLPTAHDLPSGIQWSEGNTRIWVLNVAPPEPRAILHDGALVMFTSGSTGEAKGVILSREALGAKLAAINEVLHFPLGVRSLLVLQLSFAFGQWVSLLTLLQGGTLIIASKFTSRGCLRALSEAKVDQVAVVPTMMRAMLVELRSEQNPTYLSQLNQTGYPRLICTGGEPLAATLGQQFRKLLPHTQIADVFGLTETCTSDIILPPDLFDRHPGSIGFPSPGVEIRIMTSNEDERVEQGEVGELEIKTPFVMAGYLDAPELTRAAFHDEFVRTGDLAWQSPTGALYLAGRSKDLILRGGNKVSPIEVDAVMIQHPDVNASLTTGIPDEMMGERIHTLIVLDGKSNLSAEDLRVWARTKLDKYKVPDQIHLGTHVPQGRTGKDDRAALYRWLNEQGALSPSAASKSKEEET